jgi:hypothetical protein
MSASADFGKRKFGAFRNALEVFRAYRVQTSQDSQISARSERRQSATRFRLDSDSYAIVVERRRDPRASAGSAMAAVAEGRRHGRLRNWRVRLSVRFPRAQELPGVLCDSQLRAIAFRQRELLGEWLEPGSEWVLAENHGSGCSMQLYSNLQRDWAAACESSMLSSYRGTANRLAYIRAFSSAEERGSAMAQVQVRSARMAGLPERARTGRMKMFSTKRVIRCRSRLDPANAGRQILPERGPR